MTTAVSSATTSTTPSSSNSDINSGLNSLASNYQTFLTLLTTQLKNQDPSSPLDTNQFTAQLTQMTGVEQQIVGNQYLQQLVGVQAGLPSAANLIGKTITAPGANTSDPAVSGVVTGVEL